MVLQENEYSIKHLMFKELRQHLITIQSQRGSARADTAEVSGAAEAAVVPVAIRNIPPSLTVRALQP